jgi:hypothetical protein
MPRILCRGAARSVAALFRCTAKERHGAAQQAEESKNKQHKASSIGGCETHSNMGSAVLESLLSKRIWFKSVHRILVQRLCVDTNMRGASREPLPVVLYIT